METMGVDAPPSADVPQRGGFLTTLPGILTGVAGIISAGGVIWAGYVSSPHGADPPPQPTPVSTSAPAQPTPEVPAQPTPEVPASVDVGSVATRANGVQAADVAKLSNAAIGLWTDCASGWLDSCVPLLDQLLGDCYYGNPYGCDALYWISPVGSDYEAYGATCGDRSGSEYIGRCSEL
jgi:hypothetical protein